MQLKQEQQNSELMQAMDTCDRLFENLASSYRDLEASFHHLSSRQAQQSGEARAEELLVERLASIIDALPAGVVIIDGRGQVLLSNPAAEDLLGVPLRGEKWCDIIARAFTPKLDDGHDISLVDGRIVNISTTPLGNQPGQVVLVHDVTRTRELQDKLLRDRRLAALGQMAAGMAHQIRTPVSSAMLYCSHLKNPQLNDEKRNQLVDKVIARMRHLEQLVNDMLLYAKGGGIGDETFAIDELVADVLQSAETQLLDGAVKLSCVNEMPGARLKGNRQMLLSAVANLVENAFQALQGRGEIALCVQPASAGSLDIRLSDNGPGIAREKMERIFEPFFTTRSSGTGLGLAVVRLIAQAHHGDVWVDATGGQGSTFIIRLPCLEPGRFAQDRSGAGAFRESEQSPRENGFTRKEGV